MLNPEKIQKFCDNQWQEVILTSLCDYIKIPNKSPDFDPLWQEHGYMDLAMAHLVRWCTDNAPPNSCVEVVQIPNRTPLLFIEIAGTGDAPIVLYGHMDKQPEMMGWDEGLAPWKPVIRGDKLYGRGAADDGYSVYAAITAINALVQQDLPHPRCIILIEASEESGSIDLPFYMDLLEARIGNPGLVICLDSGAGNYDQLWVTTSLRGNIVGKLTVQLLREGLHSGYASGIAADSFRIIRQLLSRVENETDATIRIKEMHCEVPEQRRAQVTQCAAIMSDQVYTSFPWAGDATPVTTDVERLLLNRTWRPALTVTGLDGLPSTVDAGNVLGNQITVKLSLRIPPLVSPGAASQALERELTTNPPYRAKVSFSLENASSGWNAPITKPWLIDACEKASQLYFQKPAAYLGEGGTIPFMSMLGNKFPQAQFLITGVLGPNANAHGPNEFLQLSMVKKITSSIAVIIYEYGQQSR